MDGRYIPDERYHPPVEPDRAGRHLLILAALFALCVAFMWGR